MDLNSIPGSAGVLWLVMHDSVIATPTAVDSVHLDVHLITRQQGKVRGWYASHYVLQTFFRADCTAWFGQEAGQPVCRPT